MRKTIFGKSWLNFVIYLSILLFFIPVSSTLAKEKKHGAELEILAKYGSFIKGELLAVKGTKLILMESGSKSEVDKDISEVRSIKIVNKSKFLKGAGYGLLIGGGSGFLLGILSGDDPPDVFMPMTALQKAFLGGAVFGILGAPIGGLFGAMKGKDESINLEGRSAEEIKLILKKLNKKARIPQELSD